MTGRQWKDKGGYKLPGMTIGLLKDMSSFQLSTN